MCIWHSGKVRPLLKPDKKPHPNHSTKRGQRRESKFFGFIINFPDSKIYFWNCIFKCFCMSTGFWFIAKGWEKTFVQIIWYCLFTEMYEENFPKLKHTSGSQWHSILDFWLQHPFLKLIVGLSNGYCAFSNP